MIRIFALSEQQEDIYKLHDWLKSKELDIEHVYVDINDDASDFAKEHNLTVFPVLFQIKYQNGKNFITKFADGKDINKMSDDMVATLKAELAPQEQE
jgi:hypothetical protein